jgi:hypothetical protein
VKIQPQWVVRPGKQTKEQWTDEQCALTIKVTDRSNENFAAFKGYFFGISDKPQ